MFISCLQLGSLHFCRSLHFHHRNAATSSLPSWPLLASLANFRTSSASLAVTMKDSCQGKRHGDDHHFNQPKTMAPIFLQEKFPEKYDHTIFALLIYLIPLQKKMGNVQDPCHSCIGVSLESYFRRTLVLGPEIPFPCSAVQRPHAPLTSKTSNQCTPCLKPASETLGLLQMTFLLRKASFQLRIMHFWVECEFKIYIYTYTYISNTLPNLNPSCGRISNRLMPSEARSLCISLGSRQVNSLQ